MGDVGEIRHKKEATVRDTGECFDRALNIGNIADWAWHNFDT